MHSPHDVRLVEFTAKWCGPCRVMEPIIAALAREYAGRVEVVAVDVDEEPVLAQQHDVRSMPTFVMLRNGHEVGRVVGSRPRAFLAGVLDRVLDGDFAVTAPR